jgi:sugar (glycoside-pentoside-hexuronide) transporter
MRAATEQDGHALPRRTKLLYGLGDHSVNLCLFSLLAIFPIFLTDVAGLTPTLAGLVPMIGRAIDAFTDPTMGRVSDLTRWRAGRRRPYFLIGMLPFAAAYAALWTDLGAASENAKLAFYAGAYVLFTLGSTVLSVPYLALIPEMASSYQERTSLSSYRAALAILGAFAALALPSLAAALGGGAAGYARAGLVAGIYVLLPWPLVWRATFERPSYQRPARSGFLATLGALARHGSYRSLVGLFLLGRIAIDLASAMFPFFFTYWLGRAGDFQVTMALFLGSVALSVPMWVAVSKRFDKRTIFLMGAASWVCSQVFLFSATPEWPRWAIFVGAALGGVGYAAADMMPWSMLGEVVDEDELRSGERREGVYFGLFTFLRKLGGAAGVWLGLTLLERSGYVANQAQGEATLWTIRALTAVIPGVLVLCAAGVALSYRLSRARHSEILAALARVSR